jgi:hypothetical protein
MDTTRSHIDEINTPIYEQGSSPRTVNDVKSLSRGLPSSLRTSQKEDLDAALVRSVRGRELSFPVDGELIVLSSLETDTDNNPEQTCACLHGSQVQAIGIRAVAAT